MRKLNKVYFKEELVNSLHNCLPNDFIKFWKEFKTLKMILK